MSWVGPSEYRQSPGMKSHWFQAGARHKELSQREGWQTELPRFTGASGLGDHLAMPACGSSQICPGHRADVPVPCSPVPLVPPAADSIPGALPDCQVLPLPCL